MGIIAIDIHNVKDPVSGADYAGRNLLEHFGLQRTYPSYDWVYDDGYANIGTWIENAAQAANR